MTEPQVTIIVVPRERFSLTQESLESIYEYTETPFHLVYVDGGSPTHIRQYLATQSQQKNFQLIRTNYYLTPNRARNIGLQQVSTKYVVFIDNDVIVSPGWLQQMIQCAEETGATIVTPLTGEGMPVHERVHCAGGEAHLVIKEEGSEVKRYILSKLHYRGRRLKDVQGKLTRKATEMAEFHCIFVRTAIFEKIGLLDEAVMNTKEHADFCMTVAQAGGTVYLEPSSLVTYVPGLSPCWSDLHFYMLRWSDAWGIASLKRLQKKWNLTEDEHGGGYLIWRRKLAIIRPLMEHMPGGQKNKLLQKAFVLIEVILNRLIVSHYALSQVWHKSEPTPTPLQQSSSSS
ncbi:glycosyltransferase family 2 protein [Chamaesiphon polymorphus]|uniref:Glycosyl transferase family 2 n=1 Tax=Chamaesiphon polymorphus CCALA 037 TaxID=2107692 RepID=A0A2T1FWQ6_9CYAN|nr:glycosyltransferase [Chamaesiphon polymorphus]PSB49412.1 glycosyl transferase family 2 [Chamaesiphon polymorphus CCALA 037]